MLESDLAVQQTRLGYSEAGLLNKSSCLAPALDLTKLTNVRDIIFGHTLLCHLSPTYMFNKSTSEVGLLTSNLDLISTTKCDQNHIFDNYEFDNTLSWS